MVGNSANPNRRLDGLGQSRPSAGKARSQQPKAAEVSEVNADVADGADENLEIRDHMAGLPQPITADLPFGDVAEDEPEPWPASPKRNWHWRRWVAAAVAVVVVVVGVVGIHAVLASQRVITRNATGGAPALAKAPIDPTKLKGEGDGRINVLLLGIGGPGHDGANLSDTIMVASIDPQTKDVAMLSIPRDLYVKIPGYGQSKINAANAYGGPELAKKTVSGILDLPIHYYVQVDFSGFRQAVNSVGGVDITNAKYLYDPEYPCDNDRGYCPYNLPVGQYHMNGIDALKFARCRHGSCGNDFGRAARQQQLLVALRQKALEASTLTNPVKLTGLIDSIGNHVRTDLQPAEMIKLAGIIKDVDTAKINQKVLDTSANGLLVDGSGQFAGAGSIELPKAGAFDYSQIQELAHTIFADHYLQTENAPIDVENGTGHSGVAATVTELLKAYNYNVVSTGNAPPPLLPATVIYDYTGGKDPYTLQYLEQRFGVKAQKAAPPAVAAGVTPPAIRIIIGTNYHGSVTAAQAGASSAASSQ